MRSNLEWEGLVFDWLIVVNLCHSLGKTFSLWPLKDYHTWNLNTLLNSQCLVR